MRNIEQPEWGKIFESLNTKGFSTVPNLITRSDCDFFSGLYEQPGIYRNTINMQRYRFGKGEYKYFSYPLPEQLEAMRTALYPKLAPLANEWMQALGIDSSFPPTHAALLDRCHQAGQERPTPLVLRYGAGGFNTLHQDLYGEIYFPFQVVIMLRQHGIDYEGGEFVMTEQVPRAQSIAHVVQPDQGDAVIFTTNFKPVRGVRGYYRAAMRHGISEVHSGERYALGIIFHDGK
jgi:hypothetical protein